MFGKKAKKQAELEALERKKAAAARLAAMREREEENKVFYESEIILDDFDEAEDGEDEVIDIELVLDADSMKKITGEVPPEEVLELNLEEDEDEAAKEEFIEDAVVVDEEEEPVEEVVPVQPVIAAAPIAQRVEEFVETVDQAPESDEEEETSDEPEVRYVMDGPTEDDEIVKPAKLTKLPNLVDYMLSLNMSKRMKMMVATLLLGAYAKYKDIPVEKEILIGCMKKIMMALMNENNK